MSITYDYANLRKHNVMIEEIDEILANDPLDFDLEPGRSGNDRVMFIGFTFIGRMLEVAIEFFPNDHEHIFHAMDATKYWQRLSEKRIKQWLR